MDIFWAFNNSTNNVKEYKPSLYLTSNLLKGWNLEMQNGSLAATTGSNGVPILFCEAQRSVTDDDLNEFFNDKGFNLGVKYDADNGELKENIFGGEDGKGRIWGVPDY